MAKAKHKPAAARRLWRVGLLGGSFNPAHEGHRHISLEALKRLDLDEIWWLVSPQNPLKPRRGMAPFAARLELARRVARHPRIKVSGIEARLGTNYTAHSLRALKRRFPGVRLVWLMGADNLIEIPRWEEWTEIFKTVPIAVFSRPTYSLRALNGKAAQRFWRSRLRLGAAKDLAESAPPAWIFLDGRTHPASATSIRASRIRASQAKRSRNGQGKKKPGKQSKVNGKRRKVSSKRTTKRAKQSKKTGRKSGRK